MKEVPLPSARAYGDDQVPINQLKIENVKQIIKTYPTNIKNCTTQFVLGPVASHSAEELRRGDDDGEAYVVRG